MTKLVFTALALLGCTGAALAAAPLTAAAAADEITALPGKPAAATFKMFSGYIPVSEDGTSRMMFYWYVQAQTAADTAPLMLWTNGGPGCSGLGGFMSEMGPFRAAKDGTLSMNDHSWNKIANMVFIEQPAGVGFSTNAQLGNFSYGDAQAASDNWRFVKGFMARYPDLASRPFYITSESYGGHYMPTLALEIVKNNKGEANFKGFAVGNPLTYMPYRNYGQYGTFAGHNLLPKPDWDAYVENECWNLNSDQHVSNQKLCEALTDGFDDLTASTDPYALDFPACTDGVGAASSREERHALATFLSKSKFVRPGRKSFGAYFPDAYEPCASDYGGDYLNTPAVQKAIHVEGSVDWSMCSGAVGQAYSNADVDAPMMPVYEQLVANGTLRIMVYSGDDDSICATAGSQKWIWDMNYNVTQKWSPVLVGGQLAGFTANFEAPSGAGFRFTTVHGAGHMVPQTRPAQSLEIMKKFLANDW